MGLLIASDFWDTEPHITRRVEWDLLPRSPFADAVRYLNNNQILHIPIITIAGGNLIVKTSVDELTLIIACCQRRDELENNGFVNMKQPKTLPVREPQHTRPEWRKGKQ